MPALNITCSGASYTGTTTLETMKHRCAQYQPGWPLPVNRPAEESASDESGDDEE